MLIPLLLAAGTFAQGLAGGKLILEGTEEASGVPVATAAKAFVRAAFRDVRGIVQGMGKSTGMVVEGLGDSVAAVLDPLHLFTDDPAQQRDAEAAKKKHAQKLLKQSQDKAAADAASAAQAANDADAHAKDLEAQVAAETARANTAEQQAAANLKATKVRAMRRMANVGRGLLQQSGQASSADQAMALAAQALAIASAAKNPPSDARDVLRSDMSDADKAHVANFIDSMNSDGDYDQARVLNDLQNRLQSGDPATADQAQNELAERALANEGNFDVNGHDHKHDHAPGKACKAGCDCDPCKADANALRWEGDNDVVTEGGDPFALVPTPAIPAGSLDWPGSDMLDPIPVNGRRGDVECLTGTCRTR